jgi:solute carrier family 25 protein 39/40
MLGYEYLLARISPTFTGSTDPAANTSSLSRSRTPGVTASLTPAPLVAGALARTISATVISPIEMFRTRLQALPGCKLTLALEYAVAHLQPTGYLPLMPPRPQK